MKIRSRKTNRNTPLSIDDFTLKEFSKDKEKWVPDETLSCNECQQTEDVDSKKDSPLSFLVKLKADNSRDPRSIRSMTSGFRLPDDLRYEFQPSNSHFESVSKNHFNFIAAEDELKDLAKFLHEKNSSHLDYTKDDVKKYISESCSQPDWHTFLLKPDQSKWKSYVVKALKKNLKVKYGKLDPQNIADALKIDKDGFLSLINNISRLDGFDYGEKKLLSPHLSNSLPQRG